MSRSTRSAMPTSSGSCCYSPNCTPVVLQ